MPTTAFRMQLHPGMEAEYRRRHDALWPEMAEVLKGAGISDYRIFLDRETHALFAVMTHAETHGVEALPQHPVVRRWWAHMADIMVTEPDLSPSVTPLAPVFRLA